MGQTFDTGVRLTAPAGRSPDDLERDMFDVLAAVERHADDAVVGPAVALNFATSTIDLAFTVFAETLSQVHTAVGRVLQAIEQHTEVMFSETDTHARRPAAGDLLSC